MRKPQDENARRLRTIADLDDEGAAGAPAAESAQTAKRPRGRPRKRPAAEPAAAAPKRRGRPRKNAAITVPDATGTPPSRRRGRPRKEAPADSAPAGPAKLVAAAAQGPLPPAKRRGRPRKEAPVEPDSAETAQKAAPGKRLAEPQAAAAAEAAEVPAKRRGRPRKEVPVEAAEVPAKRRGRPRRETPVEPLFAEPANEGATDEQVSAKRRGRPRKEAPVEPVSAEPAHEDQAGEQAAQSPAVAAAEAAEVPAKRRGRPRKEAPVEPVSAEPTHDDQAGEQAAQTLAVAAAEAAEVPAKRRGRPRKEAPVEPVSAEPAQEGAASEEKTGVPPITTAARAEKSGSAAAFSAQDEPSARAKSAGAGRRPAPVAAEALAPTAVIQGALYVAGKDGMTPAELHKIMPRMTTDEIAAALRDLQAKLDADPDSGLTVKRFGEKHRLLTKPEVRSAVSRYANVRFKNPLSAKLMETLAIIAYNQPCTRPRISEIRGSDSAALVDILIGHGLVAELGRIDTPGRPFIYGVTEKFYDMFGVSRIEDLPEVKKFDPESFQEGSFFDVGRQDD